MTRQILQWKKLILNVVNLFDHQIHHELIKNNETGIIVPPENPSKLAEAVNELLSDKVKAEKFATNGNTFVKNNMTWDVILPKYIKFYENLLKN